MNKTKIGIIDYGAGNLGSIYNAIKYLEVKTDVVSSAEKINSFSHLILPGVGSFGKLAEKNLEKAKKEKFQHLFLILIECFFHKTPLL